MNPQDEPADTPQVQDTTDDPVGQPSPQDGISVQKTDTSEKAKDYLIKEVTLPPEAEDSGLIEKEWVDRAKQIVEHTREDPHEQQRALSQMKADYLKKRYGRDIKVSED